MPLPEVSQREDNELTPVTPDLLPVEPPQLPQTAPRQRQNPQPEEPLLPAQVPTRNTRGRLRLPSQRMRDSINQGLNITTFITYYDVLHQEYFKLQDDMCNSIAFKSTTDPDTMYYHEVMVAPDRKHFINAIVTEVNAHIENNHWALVPKDSVPGGTKILDSIWAMKRKRDLKTQEIYKHKT